MGAAYACRISSENFGAIKSENPNFTLEGLEAWLEQHGSGFFLRDENSVFDCEYMTDEVFHQIYTFQAFDMNAVFHRLDRK
jgi:hypothetical protein